MRLVDDEGKVHEVSERLSTAVRWLVTEVGPLVECRENPAKAIINLGPNGAPVRMVLELHRMG